MSLKSRVLHAALSGALALSGLFVCTQAQETAIPFYEGKQLSIIIGSSIGGGYDAYARLLGRHLGEHLPGNPTIVLQNMPGAGSNKAAAYIYGVAPKDGTVMAAIFSGAILEPLLGDKPVPHDPSKFNYVGSANNEFFLCVARSDAAVKSFKDTLALPLTLAASAEGGSTRDFPTLLNNVLGTKFHVVTGYPGSREEILAVEQGEAQGQCGLGWSSLNTLRPDWIPTGKVRILAQEALKGHPAVTKMGVPLTLDFAKTEADRQVLELVYSQEVFGRPFVLPPGVPADRVATLRQAFMETLRDPDLLADAKKNLLDVDPISGEEVQALVAKAYATPQRIVARARRALAYLP